jgi:hypothetical protein
LVAQYTTRLLMPDVEKRLDDIQHENYHIPSLMFNERVLIIKDRTAFDGVERVLTEADYVDGRVEKTYTEPSVELNTGLTSQDIYKLNSLNELLRALVDGKSVADKKLKSVLSADEFTAYTEALTTEQHQNEILYSEPMPSELHSYQAMLKKADFQHNKFEKMSGMKAYGKANFKKQTLERESNKVDSLYEDALERLREIWSEASPYEQHQIQLWMDREIDLDAGTDSSIDIYAETMPRIRGSKSKKALDSGLPKLSKRLKRKECQLVALRDAAWSIAFKKTDAVEGELTAEQTEMLRKNREKLQKFLSNNLNDY